MELYGAEGNPRLKFLEFIIVSSLGLAWRTEVFAHRIRSLPIESDSIDQKIDLSITRVVDDQRSERVKNMFTKGITLATAISSSFVPKYAKQQLSLDSYACSRGRRIDLVKILEPHKHSRQYKPVSTYHVSTSTQLHIEIPPHQTIVE